MGHPHIECLSCRSSTYGVLTVRSWILRQRRYLRRETWRRLRPRRPIAPGRGRPRLPAGVDRYVRIRGMEPTEWLDLDEARDLGRALAVGRTGGEPSAVGISRVARVAVSWPVRAQPHFHAGTADIPEYLGRCQRRSCNHELARGWEANCKSRYQPRPMVRST
jgi:hypothetical protein